ncbi:MAG: hypothetical protein C4531_04315 [Desulfurivibrio sp.]|nr:MAG: hypothetical protein C4531_04315 [Desulfurivibrio sp.]
MVFYGLPPLPNTPQLLLACLGPVKIYNSLAESSQPILPTPPQADHTRSDYRCRLMKIQQSGVRSQKNAIKSMILNSVPCLPHGGFAKIQQFS